MSFLHLIVIVVLLAVLTIASYIDRLYSEMGKFLSREFQENIDAWEQQVEPHLGMGRERTAQAAAMLTQLTLAALALVFGDVALHMGIAHPASTASDVAQTLLAIVLAILLFNQFLPQLFFTRTRGRWIARLTVPLRILFYLVLPVTLALAFLLSIAAFAEPTQAEEAERPTGAVEALIEAGKEEGILEESDRALIRSAVEFGDKIVREVMTPRPAIYAVPASMTLAEFTEQLRIHAYSRVPVYATNLDDIVGIAFLHDLLHVTDVEAAQRSVGSMVRPAMFTPETKNIQSLLREMQHDKQHMALVIDEYGGLAGLVTIEDLVEEIVGAISDEHEPAAEGDFAQSQPDGSYIVPGSFERARLGELFDESIHLPVSHSYVSTTLGGLMTEAAGHIPQTGEVVDLDGLRLEALASSVHRVERIRVRPIPHGDASGEAKAG